MFKSLLLIGAGGFLGSIARFLTSNYVARLFASLFPLGTMVTNIAGCLLIGIFYALSEKGNVLTPEWRIFLTTGFCGGFTTFSTFSYESINLMQGGEYGQMLLNIAGNVLLGFAATFMGILIIKSL